MGLVRRAWQQVWSRGPGEPSPVLGIAIVVAATAVVLVVGWGLAAIAALLY